MQRAMRLRSWLTAVLLVLVLTTPSAAAVLSSEVGDLYTCTAACTTGASPDAIAPGGSIGGVKLQLVSTGTTAATVEQCIEKSPDTCTANSTWKTISAASTTCPAFAASGDVCVLTTHIAFPAATPTAPYALTGFVRVNVGTCSGCTYRFFYRYSFPK